MPNAERDLRDLGLSPIFDDVKKRFETFNFYEEAPEFGAKSVVSENGQVVYYVVYTCDWPTLMDLACDDDLISELRVLCVPASPEEREALYAKYHVVFKGIVHSVENALKPVRFLAAG